MDNQWTEIREDCFRTVGETTEHLNPGSYTVTDLGFPYGVVLMKMPKNETALFNLHEATVGQMNEDLNTFWSRGDKYKKHGLPHRRGILLSGPPGTGKTCILRQVSEQVETFGGFSFWWDDSVTVGEMITTLNQFKRVEGDKPIALIIEDVDRSGMSDQKNFLNMLDGAAPLPSGIVFLCTANHPEELDNAFRYRPGRIDVEYLVEHIDRQARELYINSILGDEYPNFDTNLLVEVTEGLPISYLKELTVCTVILGHDITTTAERMKKSVADLTDEDDE